MKLSVRGMATSCALLWGGAVLATELAHGLWPAYGMNFLQLCASIYPGYHPATGPTGILIGTIYGLFDGGSAGLFLAWLYNIFSGK